ncbi:Cytoskeleton-associated protein 5 [Smittium culicis]|uniref:Cytoskeleton-associated protein 5 n=1 Tax=Smittium culicis TaxID=133412 RepID=A0A1R1YEQ0_9FUNG|nr:Cytoskeleton-associated protein 5 [Smittium culicis]
MADENEDYSSLPLKTRLAHKIWKVRLNAYTEAEKLFSTIDPDTEAYVFNEYEPFLKKIASDANVAALEAGIGAVLKFVENTPNPTSNFGTKHVNIKVLCKSLTKPLTNKDVSIRGEGKKLTIELYKWIGPALKPIISNLDPVLIKELESEFEKLPSQKPKPLRLLRSEMDIVPDDTDNQMDVDQPTDTVEDAQDISDEIDPWDLADPVQVLSKIPSDFYSNVTSQKWKERKESLESLITILNSPKYADGSYDELVNALAGRISDTNILVAVLAANCIEKLSTGLRSGFASYSHIVSKPLIDRMKEKKANVVTALNQAIISVFRSTGCQLKGFVDVISHGLSQKNPQIKSSTLKFFTECLKMTTERPSKGQIKEYVSISKPSIDDSDPTVRESGFELLGTLMKLVTEKALLPFIEGIDKAKEQKIKQYFETAVVQLAPQSAPKLKPQPTSAPGKKVQNSSSTSKPTLTSSNNQKETASNMRNSPLPNNNYEASNSDLDQNINTENNLANPKIPPALLRKLQASTKLAAEKKAARTNAESNDKKPLTSNIQKFPNSSTSQEKTTNNISSPPKPPQSKTSTTNSESSSKKAFSNSTPAEDSPSYKFSNITDLEERVSDYIPNNISEMIQSKAWKERLEGMNLLKEHISSDDDLTKSVEPELIVRFIGKYPGWKESNFQVNSSIYALLQWMAEACDQFNSGAAALSIKHLIDKIGDIKLKVPASNTLIAFSERLGLRFVLNIVLESLSTQKSPKVLTDGLGFIDTCILEFGTRGVSLRPLIKFVTSVGLGSSNAQVRSKSVVLMGTLFRYVGKSISGLIGDINPQLNQLLESEFTKYTDSPTPVPTRSQPDSNASASNKSGNSSANQNSGSSNESELMDELYPRVDISGKFNSAFIKKLGDSNWKIRKEQLDFISTTLEQSNKRILPTLSVDFFAGLKGRLNDANKNLIALALDVLASLCESIGSAFDRYIKIIGLSTIMCLADKKPNVRLSAIKALDSFSLNNFKSFDQLIFLSATALQNDSPELRKDLLGFISNYFKKSVNSGSQVSQISPSIGNLSTSIFSCLQDKNSEVRKNALFVTKYIIEFTGFYELKDICSSQLKGSSLQTVLGMIDQLQPNEPPATIKNDTSKKVMTAAELLGSSKPSNNLPPPPQTQTIPQTLNAPSLQRQSKPTRPQSTLNTRDPKARIGSSPQSVRANSEQPNFVPQAQSSSYGGTLRRPMAVRKLGPSVSNTRSNSPQPRSVSQLSSDNYGYGDNTSNASRGRGSGAPIPPIISGDARSKENRSRRENLSQASSRWVFNESPRPELISSLSEQMSSSFSTEILGQLFSTGIELAEHLIEFLENNNVQLSDYESNLIIPHLISRLGDSKESIRFRVRILITTKLPRLLPPSKIFNLIIETGLKNSRNSRTRQESLDTLTYLIDKRTGGLGLFSVCPDPSKVVRMIGNSIRDKDASVRTSALNCLVAFCFQLPGGVSELWSFVGPLPDKERGMLEEKIKRSDLSSKSNSSQTAGRNSPSINTFKRSSILPQSRLRPQQKLVPSQLKTPTGIRTSSSLVPPSPPLSQTKPNFIQSPEQINEPLPQNKSSDSIKKFNLPNFSAQNSSLNNSYSSPSQINRSSQSRMSLSSNYDQQQNKNSESNSFQSSLLNTIENLSYDAEGIIAHLDNLIETLSTFVNNSRAEEHILIGQNINQLSSKISELINISFRQSPEVLNNPRFFDNLRTSSLKALQIITNDLVWAQKLDKDGLTTVFDNLVVSMSQLSPKEGSYVRVINSSLTDIIRNCKPSVLIPLTFDLFTKSNVEPIKFPLLTVEEQNRKKYVDIVQRCLWRIEKGFTQEINQLLLQIENENNNNLGAIFVEYGIDLIFMSINNFFETISEKEWEVRSDSSMYVFGSEPMESVKSILKMLINNLKDLSWLFIGQIIKHLTITKNLTLPFIGDTREDLDLVFERRLREVNEFVEDLVKCSYVISFIRNSLQSSPNTDHWEFILNSMDSEMIDKTENSQKSNEIKLMDDQFKESLLVSPNPSRSISYRSPTQHKNIINPVFDTSSIEFKKTLNKTDKTKSVLANFEIDDIIASYQLPERTSSISSVSSSTFSKKNSDIELIRSESTRARSITRSSFENNSSDSLVKDVEMKIERTRSQVSMSPISDIDLSKFPIAMSLRRSENLRNSNSNNSIASISSSVSNNSEGESEKLNTSFRSNFNSSTPSVKPTSVTFDNRLKELKDRLDAMRNKRFGL